MFYFGQDLVDAAARLPEMPEAKTIVESASRLANNHDLTDAMTALANYELQKVWRKHTVPNEIRELASLAALSGFLLGEYLRGMAFEEVITLAVEGEILQTSIAVCRKIIVNDVRHRIERMAYKGAQSGVHASDNSLTYRIVDEVKGSHFNMTLVGVVCFDLLVQNVVDQALTLAFVIHADKSRIRV